ncbi:MAG: hypothetical protein MZV64_23965 [Ignavibacteriales bacterium]|nr:hypothetical protein [Ignavibacteriales bacterium]
MKQNRSNLALGPASPAHHRRVASRHTTSACHTDMDGGQLQLAHVGHRRGRAGVPHRPGRCTPGYGGPRLDHHGRRRNPVLPEHDR